MDRKPQAIIVMNNKDTYYVTEQQADAISKVLEDGNSSVTFIAFIDAKSQSRVTVNLSLVSSMVVIEGVRRG